MHVVNLTVKNGFAHKDTSVSFKVGINWLTGENEGGKSELLDMIGYSLFGKGLKTDLADYVGLEVSLFFKVKNEYYYVIRGKKTQLYKVDIKKAIDVSDKTIIATGKTATTTAITTLLGYDYSVYESLNYSKQLDSTGLTSAGKTERLNLINKINGVHEATAFEKHLDTIKKDLKSQLKVYQGNNLIELVDFEIQEELEELTADFSTKLTQQSNEQYEKVKELESLSYQVNYLPKQIVINKQLPPQMEGWSVNDVNEYIDKQKTINDKKNTLKALTQDLAKLKASIKVPTVLAEQTDLSLYEQILQQNKAFKLQEDLLRKHEISCPNCSISFTPEHVKIDTSLKHSPLNLTEEVYKESKHYYANEHSKISRYASNTEYCEKLSEEISLLEVQTPVLIANDELQEVKTTCGEIYTASIQNNSRVLLLESLFEKNPSYTDLISIQKDLERLPQLQQDFSETNKLKERCTNYFAKKEVYLASLKAQASINKQVTNLEDKLVIVDALLSESKRLKLEIQNNCIPVLNTIASKMINKLTGGKRYGLTLNDTFELQLDGKPIQGYSGSTIVLANVAFRIALIEMFFKKTFPVFIGDEIDAFADPVRAQHIHDSLLKLNKEGYQLILVSHNLLDFQGNKIDLADIKKVK